MAYSLEKLTEKIYSYTSRENYLTPEEDEGIHLAIKNYFAKHKARLSKDEFEKITMRGDHHSDIKKEFVSGYVENVIRPYILKKAAKKPGKKFESTEFIDYLKIDELHFVALARIVSQISNKKDNDLVGIVAPGQKKFYRYDPECAELVRGDMMTLKSSCYGGYCNMPRCPKNKTETAQENTQTLLEKQSCETLINS